MDLFSVKDEYTTASDVLTMVTFTRDYIAIATYINMYM